jgi:CDP-diacylglycerol--serine O-phosphatidyltransferase
MLKQNLPNSITLLNLLCGCLGLQQLFVGDPDLAPWFIVAAGILDFFDGMAARALGVSSPIGKDLDSLADVVSFGVLPAFLAFYLIRTSEGAINPASLDLEHIFPSILVLIMALISALRLARFNHDTRQSTSFIGMPTPANGFLWAGIFYGIRYEYFPLPSAWFITAAALLCSFLLISEIPMFSFKLGKAPFKKMIPQLVFIILAIPLLVWLKIAAFAVLIACYVAFSAVMMMFPAKTKAI